MKSNYGIIGLLCAAGAAAAELLAGDMEPTLWARDDFGSFGKTLGLSEADIKALGSQLVQDNTSNGRLKVACLTAQVCLGQAQVDTSPLNETVVDENWSQTCIAEPYCIIQPRNAGDVSVSVKIIGFFKVKFAVRSGGHSPNPGWSSVGHQGILIDMQRLKSVSLSSDGTFASVGPGARWGEVYAALDPKHAVVIGGRLPEVGVGGLILGGGYFHISGQFGLAADNVKNFEIVLSSGKIINANANENADLFSAQKGGGPNFGIVTRFDLYTVPVYEVWGQINVYSPAQAPDVLDAFDQWQTHGASDIKSNVALNIGLDSITVGLVYSEPVAQAPSAFAPILAVQPVVVAVPPMNLTFNTVNQILASTTSKTPARHDYRGVSTRVDKKLTRDVYNFWREKAAAARTATGVNQTFVIQNIPANLVQQGIKKGGNAMNIPSGNQQWWTTLVDWEKAQDDDAARSVSIATTAQWNRLAAERGLDLPFVYMNDASRDQNPLASYGANSVAKLKAASRKYDPAQLFQTLQNGGFLLSKV